jgi:acyl carrier protein
MTSSNGLSATLTGERIRQFLLGRFPQARSMKIADDDHLLEKGIIDSLGVLDVVAYLEQEFSITVGDDDLTPDHFSSVASLVAFVLAKRDSRED